MLWRRNLFEVEEGGNRGKLSGVIGQQDISLSLVVDGPLDPEKFADADDADAVENNRVDHMELGIDLKEDVDAGFPEDSGIEIEDEIPVEEMNCHSVCEEIPPLLDGSGAIEDVPHVSPVQKEESGGLGSSV